MFWVEHFKTEEYQTSGRGKAGRCNLKNELNMFVSIFYWYKQSEVFEGNLCLGYGEQNVH